MNYLVSEFVYVSNRGLLKSLVYILCLGLLLVVCCYAVTWRIPGDLLRCFGVGLVFMFVG